MQNNKEKNRRGFTVVGPKSNLKNLQTIYAMQYDKKKKLNDIHQLERTRLQIK